MKVRDNRGKTCRGPCDLSWLKMFKATIIPPHNEMKLKDNRVIQDSRPLLRQLDQVRRIFSLKESLWNPSSSSRDYGKRCPQGIQLGTWNFTTNRYQIHIMWLPTSPRCSIKYLNLNNKIRKLRLHQEGATRARSEMGIQELKFLPKRLTKRRSKESPSITSIDSP